MIKKILKKYWVIFLMIALLIPIMLNFILLIPAFTNIVGTKTDWLEFWGTYLSAIASFAMVFITWKTLEQNREQLDEIKRQWDEQNKPKVFCSLEKDNSDILLVIYNASSNVATDVRVSIVNKEVKENTIFIKYMKLLENTLFTISPLQRKVVNLYLMAYVDGDYAKQFIDVQIQIGDIVQGIYRLYFQEINLIRKIADK